MNSQARTKNHSRKQTALANTQDEMNQQYNYVQQHFYKSGGRKDSLPSQNPNNQAANSRNSQKQQKTQRTIHNLNQMADPDERTALRAAQSGRYDSRNFQNRAGLPPIIDPGPPEQTEATDLKMKTPITITTSSISTNNMLKNKNGQNLHYNSLQGGDQLNINRNQDLQIDILNLPSSDRKRDDQLMSTSGLQNATGQFSHINQGMDINSELIDGMNMFSPQISSDIQNNQELQNVANQCQLFIQKLKEEQERLNQDLSQFQFSKTADPNNTCINSNDISQMDKITQLQNVQNDAELYDGLQHGSQPAMKPNDQQNFPAPNSQDSIKKRNPGINSQINISYKINQEYPNCSTFGTLPNPPTRLSNFYNEQYCRNSNMNQSIKNPDGNDDSSENQKSGISSTLSIQVDKDVPKLNQQFHNIHNQKMAAASNPLNNQEQLHQNTILFENLLNKSIRFQESVLQKALIFQNSQTQNQIQMITLKEQAQQYHSNKDVYQLQNLNQMKKQYQKQLIDANELPLVSRAARSFKEIAEVLINQLEFISGAGLLFQNQQPAEMIAEKKQCGNCQELKKEVEKLQQQLKDKDEMAQLNVSLFQKDNDDLKNQVEQLKVQNDNILRTLFDEKQGKKELIEQISKTQEEMMNEFQNLQSSYNQKLKIQKEQLTNELNNQLSATIQQKSQEISLKAQEAQVAALENRSLKYKLSKLEKKLQETFTFSNEQNNHSNQENLLLKAQLDNIKTQLAFSQNEVRQFNNLQQNNTNQVKQLQQFKEQLGFEQNKNRKLELDLQQFQKDIKHYQNYKSKYQAKKEEIQTLKQQYQQQLQIGRSSGLNQIRYSNGSRTVSTQDHGQPKYRQAGYSCDDDKFSYQSSYSSQNQLNDYSSLRNMKNISPLRTNCLNCARINRNSAVTNTASQATNRERGRTLSLTQTLRSDLNQNLLSPPEVSLENTNNNLQLNDQSYKNYEKQQKKYEMYKVFKQDAIDSQTKINTQSMIIENLLREIKILKSQINHGNRTQTLTLHGQGTQHSNTHPATRNNNFSYGDARLFSQTSEHTNSNLKSSRRLRSNQQNKKLEADLQTASDQAQNYKSQIDLLEKEKTLVEGELAKLQKESEYEMNDANKSFKQNNELLRDELYKARKERDDSKLHLTQLENKLKQDAQAKVMIDEDIKQLKETEVKLISLNNELKETIEEERREWKNRIQRAEDDLDIIEQKYEAKFFLIKNRLVILAQTLRVWLPDEDLNAEEILKEIIRQQKENQMDQLSREKSEGYQRIKRKLVLSREESEKLSRRLDNTLSINRRQKSKDQLYSRALKSMIDDDSLQRTKYRKRYSSQYPKNYGDYKEPYNRHNYKTLPEYYGGKEQFSSDSQRRGTKNYAPRPLSNEASSRIYSDKNEFVRYATTKNTPKGGETALSDDLDERPSSIKARHGEMTEYYPYKIYSYEKKQKERELDSSAIQDELRRSIESYSHAENSPKRRYFTCNQNKYQSDSRNYSDIMNNQNGDIQIKNLNSNYQEPKQQPRVSQWKHSATDEMLKTTKDSYGISDLNQCQQQKQRPAHRRALTAVGPTTISKKNIAKPPHPKMINSRNSRKSIERDSLERSRDSKPSYRKGASGQCLQPSWSKRSLMQLEKRNANSHYSPAERRQYKQDPQQPDISIAEQIRNSSILQKERKNFDTKLQQLRERLHKEKNSLQEHLR